MVVWGFVPLVEAQGAPDEILTQEYVAKMGLDKLKEQGLDGEGVTIAIIDGMVDTTVPELAGADIEIINTCPEYQRTPRELEHGTNVTSLIAGRNYGWAPKAKIKFYGAFFGDTYTVDLSMKCDTRMKTGYLIQEAINDGADIILVSRGCDKGSSAPGPDTLWALLRATELGIPVVWGAGNDAEETDRFCHPWGSLVVGAVDFDGNLASYSNFGMIVGIYAPGQPMMIRKADAQGALTIIESDAQSTSFSTPVIAGILALGMQKWPEAHGHQLLNSLVDTADAGVSERQYHPRIHTANVNPARFIDNDPSIYYAGVPNCLTVKRSDYLKEREPFDYLRYHYGLLDPRDWYFPNNADYVYRGLEENLKLPIDEMDFFEGENRWGFEPGTLHEGYVVPVDFTGGFLPTGSLLWVGILAGVVIFLSVLALIIRSVILARKVRRYSGYPPVQLMVPGQPPGTPPPVAGNDLGNGR
jgi:hypothetical protein